MKYINDTTGEVKGFPFDGAREMSQEEWDLFRNPPPTVDGIRSLKLSEIREECESHINAGFQADVLFPDCNYRNDRDQQTTMRNASESGGMIWMNEKFTYHTSSQALAIYELSKSEVESHRVRYANKCDYINDQSRTVEEITAVTWDSVE